MHTATLAEGVEPQLNNSHPVIRPTFCVACWLLAVLGFLQLLTVGTALAVRGEHSSHAKAEPVSSEKSAVPMAETIQPRSIEQILLDAQLSTDSATILGMAAHEPVRIQADLGISPVRGGGANMGGVPSAVMIANPRVERLVQESRNLHLEGDMMRAMLKLDEAGRLDPAECAVIYEKGLLFELMGIYTRAADQYQQIQQLGLVKAGPYFSLAASKLTKGMDTASARRSTIAIGPMKVNKGTGPDTGRNVEVAITLLGRPDQSIQSDDVEVQVHFYDKVNGGEIKKAALNAHISPHWADNKVDWQDAGNEETLRVSYSVPEADLAEQHLLGRRQFYGYIVELLYQGEVVDQQAYPRQLHSIHGKNMAPTFQEDLGVPWLPGDENSLLPSKNHGYGVDQALPSR